MLSLLKKFGVGMLYGMGFAIGAAGVLALGVIGGASFLTSTTGRPHVMEVIGRHGIAQ